MAAPPAANKINHVQRLECRFSGHSLRPLRSARLSHSPVELESERRNCSAGWTKIKPRSLLWMSRTIQFPLLSGAESQSWAPRSAAASHLFGAHLGNGNRASRSVFVLTDVVFVSMCQYGVCFLLVLSAADHAHHLSAANESLPCRREGVLQLPPSVASRRCRRRAALGVGARQERNSGTGRLHKSITTIRSGR